MEFEAAAKRLARDQSKLSRKKNVVVSQKAKREAEYRKKQQENARRKREREKKALEFRMAYMVRCNRALGTRSLSSSSDQDLLLQATSIHGDGDKLALPPSVLQHLTESINSGESSADGSSSPWTFRVGILRPEYKFPASPLLQALHVPTEDDDDMQEDDEEEESKVAFLDELAHKYIAYTYGTVVEFTQEEGHIGLPAPIAARLCREGDFATRTKDPATAASPTATEDEAFPDGTSDEEKTPGHLAWGAFDVPSLPVQVTMVKLPKGRNCTLVPTKEAILNGFHNLKDIKLVLEQSLIRTRATLSMGDVVHTWHRGVKFDLKVSSITPADFGAVSCINTDIEVDFGINHEVQKESQEAVRESMDTTTDQAFAPGAGHKLSDATTPNAALLPLSSAATTASTTTLLPEPPPDQVEAVCTIQIRAPNGTGRRRFDTQAAKLKDLFAFAASVTTVPVGSFQLVTRFPRRVVVLNGDTKELTLTDAGIAPGQEQFLVEQL